MYCKELNSFTMIKQEVILNMHGTSFSESRFVLKKDTFCPFSGVRLFRFGTWNCRDLVVSFRNQQKMAI